MTARRTPLPPPAVAALGDERELDDDEADAVLPLGVEPWSGADMPTGTASSHDLRAPGSGARRLALDSLEPAELGADPTGATETTETTDSAEPDAGADVMAAGLPPSLAPEHQQQLLEVTDDDERNYRHIYETRFRQLDVGLREEVARHASGSILFALCLDPAPQVVAALLENARFGLDHARSLAQHHPTDRGVEILSRRAQFLRDSHVQRRVLGNIQTPDVVIDRVLRFKRLIDVYRYSIDRDLPERNRVRIRSRLRAIFTRAEPEDRAALIIKTEGRCLVNLSGCTFDARLTQLLCNQTIVSALFIQNLARFGATPPALIAKLLRSPTVQRQPQLRALLSKHPNASGDVKRRP